MGKITKTLQPKHKGSMVSLAHLISSPVLCHHQHALLSSHLGALLLLVPAPAALPSLANRVFSLQSPWLAEYVQTATKTPLPRLPEVLDQFPARWPFPRGDMYHWIPLLNRFDNILECFVETYELQREAQTRDFQREILLQTTAHPIDFRDTHKWDAAELEALGYSEDGDCQLVLAVLKFTRNLLQHCGNRSIYASSAHLSCLLNSSSLQILKAALHVGHELALRYHASYKRASTTSRVFHSALLINHYDISLNKVHQLAAPFVKTPIASSSAPFATSAPSAPSAASTAPGPSSVHAATASPATPSASKGKEKATAEPSPKTVSSMYTNDFVAIAAQSPADASAEDPAWSAWGDIKITYYPHHQPHYQPRQQDSPDADPAPTSPSQQQGAPERSNHSAVPSTPTPLRRASTLGSQTHERSPRIAGPASDDASSPLTGSAQARTPGNPGSGEDAVATSAQRTFELSHQDVSAHSLYELMARCPADMPPASRYELLSRIRVAKALLGSIEERHLALAVRLLAITNLAFIHPEMAFLDQVLKQDSEEPRRFQLVYQLAELIRPGVGTGPVPIWLQSIALQLLESLAGFASKTNDVISAVNATVNHGVLLYVLRKAVADMKEDEPDSLEDRVLMDDWRKQLFSLTLHLTAGNRMPDIIAAGLMDILIDALKVRSSAAERNYLVVVTFLDTVVLNFPTSFQSFARAQGLDVISQLLIDTVNSGLQIIERGEITRLDMRCSVIDYDIPFYLQQTLKWLLKFIYHLMASSYQFGPGNDHLLRNLVDNSQLLHSLRTILEKTTMFGSVVWTNAATTLSHFINHDPTSFAALAESGLVQSFIETITGRPLPPDALAKEQQDEPSTNSGEGSNQREDENAGESRSGEGSSQINRQTRNRNGRGDANNEGRDAADNLPPDEMKALLKPLTDEQLATPRTSPLAGGILPSAEAISAIPSILNSICLNRTGQRMVMVSGALQGYLGIFESPAHIHCMDAEPGLASTIGSSFDELARHHPLLRPLIATAVYDMLRRVVYLANNKGSPAGWGLRLLPTAVDAEPASSGVVDEDVEMADADSTTGPEGTRATGSDRAATSASSSGSDSDAFLYVSAAAMFINVYLNNSTLLSLFVERGGIEAMLDLVEARGLPFIQHTSMLAPTMMQIFAQLFEQAPILGVPSIFSRILRALEDVEPLVKGSWKDAAAEEPDVGGKGKGPVRDDEKDTTAGSEPYFARFVRPNGPLPSKKEVAAGTNMVKALFRARFLMHLAQMCFPMNRQGATTMHPIVLYDYYERFIELSGPLLAYTLSQETALGAVVPSHWSRSSIPTLEGLDNQGQAEAGATGTPAGNASPGDSSDDSSQPAITDVLSRIVFTLPSNGQEESGADANGDTRTVHIGVPVSGNAGTAEASGTAVANSAIPAPPSKPGRDEQSSPAYKNFQQLRTLLRSFTSVITADFQSIGKALFPRRDRDQFTRCHHARLADMLMSEVLGQLKAVNESASASHRHRKLILEAIGEMLVDPTRLNERADGVPTSYIVVPLLMAFKTHGGFEMLNDMLRSFSQTIIDVSQDNNSLTQLYFAAISMKSILDLYATIANVRNIQESVNQISVMARPGERQYFNPQQFAPQLVAEVWIAVMPVISELWQSPVLERVSTGVLATLIDIMKTIATGDLEHGFATRENRPKVSPTAFMKTDAATFVWAEVLSRKQLVSTRGSDDFPEELVIEALYRANGHVENAQQYARAIHSGRLPALREIPAEDRPPATLPAVTPSAEEGREGAEATGAADAADANAADTNADASQPQPGGQADPTTSAVPILPFSLASMELDNPSDRDDASPGHVLSQWQETMESLERSYRDEPTSSSSLLPPPPLPPPPPPYASGSTDNADDSGVKDDTSSAAPADIVTKEDLDEAREDLCKDLIDRCLGVLQMHSDSVQDIADLISACVLKSGGDEASISAQQDVGETLTEALLSFAIDEENKKENAQSIAAYAYLLCLLIQQSESFFACTVDILRSNIDKLLEFLQTPSGASSEDLPPWLPQFFLLFEMLLIKDEQEPTADWVVPTLEAEKIEDLVVETKELILNEDDRQVLLDSILEILPRIGKDEILAVAASRLLVIMTRRHDVAKVVGDKKNLQRLFLMAKQLSGIGASGFLYTRLSSYIATVLRHIVEDDDVLRQIMRYEICMVLNNTSHAAIRSHDLRTFLELVSHVALRSPKLFVSVVADTVKIVRWPAGSLGSSSESLQRHSYTVRLKEGVLGDSKKTAAPKLPAPASSSNDDSFGPAVQATQELNINDVRPSTETEAGGKSTNGGVAASSSSAKQTDNDMPDAAAKTEAVVEHKRPVVENPDGVITFLLEQLMTYQKVDDVLPVPLAKDATPAPLGTDIPATPAGAVGAASQSANDAVSVASSAPGTPAPAPSREISRYERAPVPLASASKDRVGAGGFKAADHPIFVFRAYLMFSLSELLRSYTRCKM